MPCFLNVESFLISSDLIALQLLLEIVHCIPLSPQSVSSHLILTHLMSSQLFQRISPHPVSCLLPFSALLSWSRLFSSLLMSFELFSSLFISASLSSLKFSQLFSTLLSSFQLILRLLISFSVFSHLLSSSHTSSANLSWSLLLSARHTSSQLFSAHSQITSALKLKTCSKNGSRRRSKRPLRFPQRRVDTEKRSVYTQRAFAQRSLYTQKLFHRNR